MKDWLEIENNFDTSYHYMRKLICKNPKSCVTLRSFSYWKFVFSPIQTQDNSYLREQFVSCGYYRNENEESKYFILCS